MRARFWLLSLTVMLWLRVSPALAQIMPPPPGGHVHNWTPLMPPNAGFSVQEYARARAPGQPNVFLSLVRVPCYNIDRCVNGGCSFPGGTAYNEVVYEWSDLGAGGQFGRMEGGTFVGGCPANYVDTYMPAVGAQLVTIALTANDVPHAFDPVLQTLVPTYDDGGISQPRRATLWDFLIEGPDEGWRPMGGADANTVSITLRIEPAADHHNNPMQAQIVAGVVDGTCSQVPGVCTNKPRPALPNHEHDYQLQDPQDGWLVYTNPPNKQRGYTVSSCTTATLVLQSLDYGGWCQVDASILSSPTLPAGTKARDARRLAAPVPEFASVPYDVDGDHIADGRDADTGPITWDGFSGDWQTARDPYVLRPGNSNRGDGLSRYEKYRGLILGGQWQELQQSLRHVFVYDKDSLGLGCFADTQLHIVTVTDADTDAAGVINCFTDPATRMVAQKRIRLEAGGLFPGAQPPDGLSVYCGETLPGPGVPSTIDRCVVYTQSIDTWVENSFQPHQWAAMKARIREITVSHELGHAVNMAHHPSTGTETCVMRYWVIGKLGDPTYYNSYCTSSPGEVLTQMMLRTQPPPGP